MVIEWPKVGVLTPFELLQWSHGDEEHEYEMITGNFGFERAMRGGVLGARRRSGLGSRALFYLAKSCSLEKNESSGL